MALTENTKITSIPDPSAYRQPTLAGAIHFFKNAICNLEDPAAGGFLKLGGDVANETFAGIAQEELNQAAGGSDGDNEVLLIPAGSNVVVLLTITGVTQADVNKDVFVVDDASVALAGVTTNDVRVGKIFAITKNANEALILLN